MRRSFSIFTSLVLLLSGLVSFVTAPVASAVTAADFQPGRIIDDQLFYDSGSMSPAQIQVFLKSQLPQDSNGNPACDMGGNKPYYGTYNGVTYNGNILRKNLDPNFPPPYTCLYQYVEDTKVANSGIQGSGGNNIGNPPWVPNATDCPADANGLNTCSAAYIIYNAAQQYTISPKVLIVLLQKEQNLVTDDWPWYPEYKSATGYGCPDTAACNSTYYGFYNQVHNAAKQFRLYANNPSAYNYTIGSNQILYHYPRNITVNGQPVDCGIASVTIQNQATASLYDYTPYVPNQAALNNLYGSGDACSSYGNRNFWRLYNDWFGPTVGCQAAAGPVADTVNFAHINGAAEQGVLNLLRGTGSNCVEAHIWNSGMQTWQTHIASNQGTVDPSNTLLEYADLDGSGHDVPVLIGLRGTGSGKIEFHIWNPSMQTWQTHIASNQPTIDPANSTVEFADVNGDGKDEAVLVGLRATGSGMVEFHVWNPGMQSWQTHIASNQPAIDPANSAVEFADLTGSGHDQAVLVGLRATGSGKVEFHVWNPGMSSWQSHTASNQPAVDPANSAIGFADLTGSGHQSAILEGLRATGSGMIEFHVWNPGMQSWQTHIASNQITL